jgi:hypothetical protein
LYRQHRCGDSGAGDSFENKHHTSKTNEDGINQFDVILEAALDNVSSNTAGRYEATFATMYIID